MVRKSACANGWEGRRVVTFKLELAEIEYKFLKENLIYW